jgi:hypothetical protein
MKKGRDDYIVIAPAGKSKIYSVAARRIGSKERYSVVATCTSDMAATQLVEGLRLRQGEVIKIDTLGERALVDAKELLKNERQLHTETRMKLNDAQRQKRMAEDQTHTISRDLASMTDRMFKAEQARDAAQKIVRTDAGFQVSNKAAG